MAKSCTTTTLTECVISWGILVLTWSQLCDCPENGESGEGWGGLEGIHQMFLRLQTVRQLHEEDLWLCGEWAIYTQDRMFYNFNQQNYERLPQRALNLFKSNAFVKSE